MKAQIHITLKNGVLDPQGKATETTLNRLGFNAVKGVRQGKLVEVELGSMAKDEAEKTVHEMCKTLLANPVMENYTFELVD